MECYLKPCWKLLTEHTFMLWQYLLRECISSWHFHLSYFSSPAPAPSVPMGKLVNLCRNKVTLSFNPHPSRRNMSVGNHIHPLHNCVTMLTLLAQKIPAPFLVVGTNCHKGRSKAKQTDWGEQSGSGHWGWTGNLGWSSGSRKERASLANQVLVLWENS